MAVTFVPHAGFTYRLGDDDFVVTRYDDQYKMVHIKRVTEGKPRYSTCQGLDFWNSKTQIARLATLRELGHHR